MTRRFQQMQPEERVTLVALRQQGQSLRQIGQVLGRSAGSLSRELKRNSTATGGTVAQTREQTP
jgi:IS30 family transposase